MHKPSDSGESSSGYDSEKSEGVEERKIRNPKSKTTKKKKMI